MRRTIGGNARDRRRARRAAARRNGTSTLSHDDVREIEDLVASASGSTGLPLSDRNVSWDADSAAANVKKWAGADDAPNAKYASAFFIKDGDGSNFGDYHLPFADVVDGKLTAIWKGVTAVAGALQGARGASITGADAAAAKAKVESYYAKAAKQYDDDTIKVPWGDDSSENAGDLEDFLTEAADELGGKPNPGTKPDKRLKENKRSSTGDAEDGQSALDAIDEYQAAVKCACGHVYSEHTGAGGTCGHEDGRGTCRCGEFAYPTPDPAVEALAAVVLAQHPDLDEYEVMRIARRFVLALTSAAGDVVWGPEEGFMDLICDVNQLLHPNTDSGDDGYDWGLYCVDASVNLDKVLICDHGDYYVAPISIDGAGEPVLSDKTDWVMVEDAGYIETDDTTMTAARLRSGLHAFLQRNELGAMVLTKDELRRAMFPEFAPAVEVPAPAEVLPEDSDEITPASAPVAGEIPWHSTFLPEGKLTEDGRSFSPGSVILPPDEQARQLPLTLMAMIKTSAEGGHDGAEVAGRIDDLYRNAPLIEADGVFSKEDYGQMIARMVESGELTGLSVDIAPLEYEWVPKAGWFDESGSWIAVQDAETGEWGPADGFEDDRDKEISSIEEWIEAAENRVLVITKAVIGMATVCPFPAFGDAAIALTAGGYAIELTEAGMPFRVIAPLSFDLDREALVAAGIVECVDCQEPEVVHVGEEGAPEFENGFGNVAVVGASETVTAVTAAAAGLTPLKPPAEWFADPELSELTPMTITEDGRIYGHAWQWETCHLSFEQCIVAPHSETNYAYFMLGEIECADGERLSVGKVTVGTPHAGTRLTRAQATAHYDQTGYVGAYVCFGEDEHGGWFAGALSPNITEEQIVELRGSTPSGDWRGVDGNLELVAILAVNVPGFPVPRGLVAAVNDEPVPVSLVAAGVVTDHRIEALKAQIDEAIVGGHLVPASMTALINDEVRQLIDAGSETPET